MARTGTTGNRLIELPGENATRGGAPQLLSGSWLCSHPTPAGLGELVG